MRNFPKKLKIPLRKYDSRILGRLSDTVTDRRSVPTIFIALAIFGMQVPIETAEAEKDGYLEQIWILVCNGMVNTVWNGLDRYVTFLG